MPALIFVRVHQMALPRTVVTTSSCSLLLIYRPQKDETLSWPSWLTSRRFTDILNSHPSAVGRAQRRTAKVRQSKTSVLPLHCATEPNHMRHGTNHDS